MVHGQGLSFVDCKRLCSADRVLDLAAIEFMSRQDVKVLFGKRHEIYLLEKADTFNEDLENGPFCLLVEPIVAERYVYARLEGVVEGLASSVSANIFFNTKRATTGLATTYLDTVSREE